MFALNQRLPGIFANIAALPTIGTLTFTTSAGADSTHTVLNLPAAPYGMKYVAKDGAGAETVTYGQKLTSGWTEVKNGDAITTATGHVVTVALVNATKGNAATTVGSASAVVGG